MKKRASFFIALRYLWCRAHEGGRYLRGAATGIAVSLIPIIVTLIVADGMITGIIDRYLEFGTGHIQIFDPSGNVEDQAELIKNIKGVRGVWPERKGMGVIAGKTGKTGVTVRATEPSFWEYSDSAKFLKIKDGVPAPQTDRDIVLGEALALNIGVNVGDTVRLMTVRTADNGNIIPRTASFTVRGIISCGYNELDALWCITSWEGGKRVLSAEQSTSSLLVKINNPYKYADSFIWDLYMELGGGFNIYTWKDLLRSQYSSYESTRQMLLFIMALIVIVAAVNVSSATSMLVLERQKDIAILKISGSNIKGIADIFLWGSFLTGLFGSIIGISFGLLIGININFLIRSLEKFLSFFSHLFRGGDVRILDPGFYLETIPIIIDWNAVFLIGFFAVVCSILASLIPAIRAGKLKPMELLRKT
ncbi:MAG: ABC transporter permease [Treponema sp.]|jgi:lipoprotein-releasing system permease protein|nr:ABC transporter permease [Treponema sp.]